MKLNNALMIQPISMARMGNALTADCVLSRYFGDIANFVQQPTNDVDIIFTTGLYLNNLSDEKPITQRRNLLQQEGNWRNRFEKLLRRLEAGNTSSGGLPVLREGFHLSGWDGQITEFWDNFSDNLWHLERAYQVDSLFSVQVNEAFSQIGREPTQQNLAFIFEETAVTALWLEGKISAPPRLREHDRLDAIHIVYPGELPAFMKAGLELLFKKKKSILPLVWVDTSHDTVHVSSHRFGCDAPSCR